MCQIFDRCLPENVVLDGKLCLVTLVLFKKPNIYIFLLKIKKYIFYLHKGKFLNYKNFILEIDQRSSDRFCENTIWDPRLVIVLFGEGLF